MVVMFCFIYLLHFLGRGELIARINMFANEYRLGYIGRRPLVGASFFFPNVYFRWTLLLIPAAILLLQGNKTKFIFVVLAVFLSTSTAAILFLFLGLLWALFSNLLSGKISKLYTKRLILIGVIVSLATFVLYYSGYGYIIEFVIDKFNVSSASISIKVGHIKSILALMSKYVTIFLFGTGVGFGFYSIGVNKVVINVEVAHFNLMRQFGILYALAFFFYEFILFIKLRHFDKTGKLLSIGLAMLFIAAGTNPLLISHIFFLLLVISRTYITLYAREKRVSPKTENFSQLAT